MKKTSALFSLFFVMVLLNNVYATDMKNWTLSPDGFGPIKMWS